MLTALTVAEPPTPVATIAAGYDGTSRSLAAIRWAESLAALTDAPLTVVSAVTRGYAEMSPETADVYLAGEFGRVAADLDARGVHARSVDVREGVAADVLGAAGDRHDLLVIGAHDGAGLTRRGYLSLAHELAESIPSVLITVPATSGPLRSDAPIVVGVDGSDGNRVAFDWARDLSARIGNRVVAVYVTDPMYDSFDSSGWYGPEEVDARHEAVDVEFVERAGGHPAQTLRDVAGELDAGLLVVGARSHLSLGGHLLGAVPGELLHRHDLPVAIVTHRYELEHS